MTRIQKTWKLAAATLITFAARGAGPGVEPLFAAGHHQNPGYKVIGQTALPNAHAADLFLRQDREGRKYIYIVYADNTLSVLDVTNAEEITEARRLALAATKHITRAEQVKVSIVAVSNTPEPEHDVTVLDTRVPAKPEIVKQFRNADCYAVDPDGDTLYVVKGGELSVLRFDRPLTRDADVFEQMLQSR